MYVHAQMCNAQLIYMDRQLRLQFAKERTDTASKAKQEEKYVNSADFEKEFRAKVSLSATMKCFC